MKIDTLEKAQAALQEALALYTEIAAPKPALQRALRNNAIQCFEFTFEIAVKLIKLAVDTVIGKKNADMLPRRDLLRKAYETSLIENPENWLDYSKARNDTVHGYDEEVIDQVFAQLPQFEKDVAYLLTRLKQYL